jgi:hypothetical protein
MDETYPAQPNLEQTPFKVFDQSEQEAFDFYMQGGSRKIDRGYQGKERRSLASQLDRAVTQITEMTYTSKGSSERDIALHEFQDWGPISLQEANTVIDGAMKRVNKAENTHSGSPDAAIKDRYYTFSGYLLDAAEDMYTLNQGMTHPENDASRPDPTLIRDSKEVLGVITKELVSRDFLWNNHWPSQNTNAYKERYKYWQGFALAISRFASNESVAKLYEFTKERNAKRFDYWLKEKNLVENMPSVQQLMRQGKIFPVTFNNLLSRKARELGSQEGLAASSEPTAVTDFEAMVPEKARQEIEAQRQREEAMTAVANEEYDREFEKLNAIHTADFARRILRQRGVGRAALSSEVRDEQDRAEIEDIARRAQKQKPQKKRKCRRRFTKSRFGWGAHAADGDARAKTSRELEGQGHLF